MNKITYFQGETFLTVFFAIENWKKDKPINILSISHTYASDLMIGYSAIVVYEENNYKNNNQ